MRPGHAINGYVLTTPFTTTGGGHCQWAFARRGDEEFFIKQFLSPTYPRPDGPGSEKTKAEKRKRCEQFAVHHTTIKDKLAPLSSRGGNLVVTRDFFLHDTHYYKVTTKIEVSPENPASIARLPMVDKLQLLLSITHSLEILHRHGLVHGDIKPPNILIEQAGERLAIKLIDFDNCFEAGNPPPADELVGDLVYYSPEMIDYIVGVGRPGLLTQKSDIFALGLAFVELILGSLPCYAAEQRYPGEAVRQGTRLGMRSTPDTEALDALVGSMLMAEPSARPDCRAVREGLQRIRYSLKRGAPARSADASVPPPAPPGLRGTLLDRRRKDGPASGGAEGSAGPAGTRAARSTSDSEPEAPAPGGLRGSLARRRTTAEE